MVVFLFATDVTPHNAYGLIIYFSERKKTTSPTLSVREDWQVVIVTVQKLTPSELPAENELEHILTPKKDPMENSILWPNLIGER